MSSNLTASAIFDNIEGRRLISAAFCVFRAPFGIGMRKSPLRILSIKPLCWNRAWSETRKRKRRRIRREKRSETEMEFRLEKKPLLLPESKWKSFARESISELLLKTDFFDVDSFVEIHFSSAKGKPEFHHQSAISYEQIFLGIPQTPPLSDSWNIASNQAAFLQTAFLHEIGHAIFNQTFSRVIEANVLLNIQPSSGRGFLDEIKSPKRKGQSDIDIREYEAAMEIHMRLLDDLGIRFKEQFSDVVAFSAGKALGVPEGTLRLLLLSRSAEEPNSPYDTSNTLRIAQKRMASRPHEMSSLSQCAAFAESIALESLRADFQHFGLLPKEAGFRNEPAPLLQESALAILSKLSKRRESEHEAVPKPGSPEI